MRDSAPCNILCLGDSITEGAHATSRSRRWTARLLTNLRNAYPTLGGEGFLPPRWASASHTQPPPATLVGGPGTDVTFGLGWRCATIQSGKSITWDVVGTSADIHYARGANSGVFAVSVDGGPPTIHATSNPTTTDDGVLRVDLGPSGPHSLTVAWSSGGTVYVDGIVVYDGDESAGIRMHEAGHFGYTTTGIRQRMDHNVYFDQRLATVAPALVIVAAGINDMSNSINPATTQANLEAMVDHLNTVTPHPSICLVGYYQRSGSFDYPWSDYQDVYRAVEAANDRVTFYDHSLRLPTYDTDPDLALMADGVHPADAGHAYLAACLADFLAPK